MTLIDVLNIVGKKRYIIYLIYLYHENENFISFYMPISFIKFLF